MPLEEWKASFADLISGPALSEKAATVSVRITGFISGLVHPAKPIFSECQKRSRIQISVPWARIADCMINLSCSEEQHLGRFWRRALDPQIEALVRRILDALPRVPDVDAAIKAAIDELEVFFPGFSETHTEDIRLARLEVEKQFEAIEILHKRSVISKRPQWYFGPRPTDLHWPALRDYLTAKGWDEDDVDVIDEASNEIVSLLDNPQDNQFSCRGLVVGHVQSGKTANMTAVIAKALDAGYNTIIVLAGLTNKLRYQTQLRMYGDMVMRRPLNWQLLTPNDEKLDFRAPPHGGFLSHTDKAQLAVVKKNVSPLNQLKKAIAGTLPAHMGRLRVLVIDDECDQASVNASSRGSVHMSCDCPSMIRVSGT